MERVTEKNDPKTSKIILRQRHVVFVFWPDVFKSLSFAIFFFRKHLINQRGLDGRGKKIN